MKIDELGCVILTTGDYRGDIGDSCAETGRFVVLAPSEVNLVNLNRFITPAGFIRHPNMPQPYDFTDFSADQGNYLLMAADLTDKDLAKQIRAKFRAQNFRPAPGKAWNPSFFFLILGWTHAVALCSLVQMAFNLLPFRWGDDDQIKSHWYSWFWRFESSSGSVVSYMTTYVSAVYYREMGLRWFGWIFPRTKYLKNALAYYQTPDSTWFQELLTKAET